MVTVGFHPRQFHLPQRERMAENAQMDCHDVLHHDDVRHLVAHQFETINRKARGALQRHGGR